VIPGGYQKDIHEVLEFFKNYCATQRVPNTQRAGTRQVPIGYHNKIKSLLQQFSHQVKPSGKGIPKKFFKKFFLV
jgi:hypothetical protein